MISAILLAAVCLNPTTGDCLPYLGTCPAGYQMNTMFSSCPSTTPVPTATATPTQTPKVTPTPTPKAEPQPTYTITEFLKPSDLGWTYVQWMSMQGNILWGDGGVCCPGLPDPSKPPGGDPNNKIGECIWTINYNFDPPVFKDLWCTSRDSSRLWESALPQVASDDEFKYVVAGTRTYRPATDSLKDSYKNAEIWGFGTNDIAGPGWQKAKGPGTVMHMSNWLMFAQGILDLNGTRWLYCSYNVQENANSYLVRFYWPRAWSIAYWDPSTNLGLNPGGSGIAIDSDGSLIMAVGQDSKGTTVPIFRSRDEGRTWVNTGIHFDAPAGRTLFGCGWEHKSGGAAVQPWHLICTEGTGLGPDTGDWHGADIRVSGAKVPASWGKVPVK